MSSAMQIALGDMGKLIELANANLKILPGPIVNVQGYGVTGNGTDETTLIQTAINYAIANNIKAVFFPHGTSGTYVATSLSNLSSVVLFGDNATLTVGGSSVYIQQLGDYARTGIEQNAIINGNFDISQRGTSFTVTNGTTAYTLDRWQSRNNGAVASTTVSQAAISDLDGSKYGLKMIHSSAPSAPGRLNTLYTLEAADSYKLAGKEVTFSCKVKAVGGMDEFIISARYNTTETAITTVSTAISTRPTLAINNSTWTDITFTFTVPIRATLTISGVFGLDIVGSNTAGEDSGDGYILAQASLCLGDTALPFQPRSFGEELALCQRYYEKSYNHSDAPGSVTINGMENVYSANVWMLAKQDVRFKVRKRVAPTITLYNTQSGTVAQSSEYDVGGTFIANRVLFASAASENSFIASASAGAFTTGNFQRFQWAADAEF